MPFQLWSFIKTELGDIRIDKIKFPLMVSSYPKLHLKWNNFFDSPSKHFSWEKNLNLGCIVSFLFEDANSVFNPKTWRQRKDLKKCKISVIVFSWVDHQVSQTFFLISNTGPLFLWYNNNAGRLLSHESTPYLKRGTDKKTLAWLHLLLLPHKRRSYESRK